MTCGASSMRWLASSDASIVKWPAYLGTLRCGSLIAAATTCTPLRYFSRVSLVTLRRCSGALVDAHKPLDTRVTSAFGNSIGTVYDTIDRINEPLVSGHDRIGLVVSI